MMKRFSDNLSVTKIGDFLWQQDSVKGPDVLTAIITEKYTDFKIEDTAVKDVPEGFLSLLTLTLQAKMKLPNQISLEKSLANLVINLLR